MLRSLSIEGGLGPSDEPFSQQESACWLKRNFDYDCDTDVLLILVAVLVLALLLMFLYILYKSNCWCKSQANDCNGNLPILSTTPKVCEVRSLNRFPACYPYRPLQYIKTEFTQRPPPDLNNRLEETSSLLLMKDSYGSNQPELDTSVSSF